MSNLVAVLVLCCTVISATAGQTIKKSAELGNAAVCIGYTAYFLCDIYGNPMPHYDWFHNGVKINNTMRFNMRQTPQYSRLRIINTIATDSGEYSCKAFNAAGDLTSSGQLHIRTDC
ncbi:immunoglobulin domain-containing protein oig-1-like [Mytilus trossulus]|uniref:immunoglobulin domain-containing protein oig-1-like n=1 Tax=Mytilus trossulus TaxID=6551 RepID=UPI0030051513